MTVSNISIERFSVVATKPFSDVVAFITSKVGHPVPSELFSAINAANTYPEMESAITRLVGPTGLMEFMRFDMGAVVGKGKPGDTAKMVRLLIGNPLTMRKMAEHVLDVGSYVPISVLVVERADGVHLSYDRVASALAGYEKAAASAVAEELDQTIEAMLQAAAR